MAKLVVLAVRDSAVGAYARPIFVPSTAVAVRSFADEVNRNAADNPMFAHADDFELHELGVYIEETGALVPLDGPVCVVRAKDVIRKTH